MRNSLGKVIDLDFQVTLIALQAAIFGVILAGAYSLSGANNELMAAIMGLLTNSLMLTQNYHGHNSRQRLYFGLAFSFICSLMFGLATVVSSSVVQSTLILLILVPLLTILNNHQLLKSFAFYLAYAFILGLGFSATKPIMAIQFSVYFALGCLLLVIGGFIRLWVRHKLFRLNETLDFAKYNLFSLPKINDIIFTLILTLSVAFSNVVSYGFNLPHGYWLPLTTLLVMRNEHQLTLIRVSQRVLGTIIGIILAYTFLTRFNHFELCLGVMFFFYTSIIALNRHYLVFCITITLLVMDLLFLGGADHGVLRFRLLETVVGVVLVVIASLLVRIWVDRLGNKKNED